MKVVNEREKFYRQKNRKKLLFIYKNYFTHLHKIKYILIGGTNGKGSTSNILQQILITKSFKVGIFTSPHLCFVNERIRINHLSISSEMIGKIVKKYKDIFIKYTLSYYEILFFVALEFFWLKKVDYAILEMGIGGEFDACNIVNPILSIITNVAFDHKNILGKTIREIALTKAHIARKNKKLIIGYWNNIEAMLAIKKIAARKKAILLEISKLKMLIYLHLFLLKYKQLPVHYFRNASLAIQAALCLKVTKKTIKKSFKKYIQLPWGRNNHFICNNVRIHVDGAHNVNAFQSLIKSLNKKHQFIIFFASKPDKDYQQSLKLLESLPNVKMIYLAAFDNSIKWENNHKYNHKYQILNFQWKEILKKLILEKTKYTILICGSLYFVGEIYHYFQIGERTKNPFFFKPNNSYIKLPYFFKK